MNIPFELALAALVVPFLTWLWWMNSDRELYRGIGHVITSSLYVGTHGYAFAQVVADGDSHLLDLSAERAYTLHDDLIAVELSVKQRAFGKPRIASVTWPDGTTDRSGGQFDGLFVAIAYLFLGLLLMPHWLWLSGLALVVSGYICGNATQQEKINLDGQRTQLVTLGVIGLFAGAACIPLFSHFSILTLFVGITAAFAFGQIAGMLARSRWTKA